jgi:hypothetical protein
MLLAAHEPIARARPVQALTQQSRPAAPRSPAVNSAAHRQLCRGTVLSSRLRGDLAARFGEDFSRTPLGALPLRETGFGKRARKDSKVLGKFLMAQPNTLRRALVTAPPAVAAAVQPNLMADQIKHAISFNAARYDDPRTRDVQQIIGTPVTGTWVDADIVEIASIQETFGYHKDGMIGTSFFRFLDLEIRNRTLPKTEANCLIAFRITGPDAPVHAAGAVAGTRSIAGHFGMAAQFSKYCNCADYEYRQFIKGHLKRKRAGVWADLAALFATEPAGSLTAGWQEDGNTTEAATNYGHRGQAAEPGENRYLNNLGATDMPAGCQYEGDDHPGGDIPAVAGDVIDFDLRFRGEIQRKGAVVETKHWTGLKGLFAVP